MKGVRGEAGERGWVKGKWGTLLWEINVQRRGEEQSDRVMGDSVRIGHALVYGRGTENSVWWWGGGGSL